MAKILILYYTRSGHTEKMANLILEGMKTIPGTEVVLKAITDSQPKEWLDYDGLLIGCPVYYGLPPWEVKQAIDRSVEYHGQLQGKLGGAFATSGNVGGGNETTNLAILHTWLIHGMLVMGDPEGDHYGPVAIEEPDERATEICLGYGKLFAQTAVRLFG